MIKGVIRMDSLVSVIMTAYNSERYIGEAIESILSQTYQNWELIIVEDGSTDGTLQIIQKYSDSRIRLLCNDKNRGTLYSMQKAMSNVRGEYVAILDSDDVSMPRRIEKQVHILQIHPEITLCAAKVNNIINGKIKKIKYPQQLQPEKLRFMALFFNPYMVHSTIMFRKKEIENKHIRYARFSYCHDYYFVLQAAAVGRLFLVDDVLGSYRIHSDQKTNTLSKLKIRKEEHGARMCYVRELRIFSENEKRILCKAISEELKFFSDFWILQHALKKYAVFCGLGRQDHDLIQQLYFNMLSQQKESPAQFFFTLKNRNR